MTEDEQREAQRLALLQLLVDAVHAPPFDWGTDLPTLADRLIKTGAVTVDVVHVMRALVVGREGAR